MKIIITHGNNMERERVKEADNISFRDILCNRCLSTLT